ncbi:hypothetical protein [Novosphingobium sp.]|uniref:hypothetical protein n=1 Tax=Novosphingobium sp. TaxID=1874826 RepID=UPI0038BBCCF0
MNATRLATLWADPLVQRIVRPYGAIALTAAVLALVVHSGANIAFFYLQRQDSVLLLAGTVLLAFAVLPGRKRGTPLASDWRLAAGIGLAMALFALAGHGFILSGYDTSRDEQLATFDAAIFARGHLFAPLPGLWRDHSDALNTMFLYPADHRGGWVSSYLPGNALIRAGLGRIASAALAGPMWLMTGALALWGCARTIWPTEREPAVVAILLYLASGQILFAGMTSFAMPAHLSLNLVWLWLFLRRAWWADACALAVGFVAVGLHQPLMHPLFAAPLLFLLLVERAWPRAAFFALGYGVIGAFWMWWPNLMWSLVQADPHAIKPASVGFLTRLAEALRNASPAEIVNMPVNLLRFVAWNPLLLLPLIALAAPAIRRDRLASALAFSCALTLAVFTVILPYQGYGYGYRYLHALLGNMILLAVFGWQAIAADKPRWRTVLMATTFGTVVVVLPLQAMMARDFTRPWAQISQRIDRVDADYVVIGSLDVPFSHDLVVNAPWLDRKPVRLLRDEIDRPLITSLCAAHPRVVLAGDGLLAPVAQYLMPQAGPLHIAARHNARLAPYLIRAGCHVAVLG